LRMQSLVVLLFACVAAQQLCSKSRCMTGARMLCNASSENADRHCCDGYECVPFDFPGNWFQKPFNTTMCTPLDSTPEPLIGQFVGTIGQHVPPVMADAWSAQTVYVNATNLDTGWGSFYYDVRFGALRVDFNPVCPFLQLRGDPWDVNQNYVPCSMIFYEGNSYYIYPTRKVCCTYKFPVWNPDWMCVSNATYSGTFSLHGLKADLFSVEWYSNFTGDVPFPLLNMRNMYLQTGTNMPMRFQEDLDTGFLDFFNYTAGDQDEAVFTELINAYECHSPFRSSLDQDRTCIHYAPINQRGNGWPCDTFQDGICVNIPP